MLKLMGIRLRLAQLLTVAAVFSILPAPGTASTVIALDLSQLVASSNEIVVGRVMSKRALRAESGHIMTEYVVTISETLKGSTQPHELVTVYQPGGSLDGIGMKVAGTTSFGINRDYLLFARSAARVGRPGLMLMPVGLSQGALLIQRDKAGHQVVIPGSGVHAVTADDRSRLKPTSTAIDKPIALATLLSRVREVIALQRVAPR